jgi:hypothetical protein
MWKNKDFHCRYIFVTQLKQHILSDLVDREIKESKSLKTEDLNCSENPKYWNSSIGSKMSARKNYLFIWLSYRLLFVIHTPAS